MHLLVMSSGSACSADRRMLVMHEQSHMRTENSVRKKAVIFIVSNVGTDVNLSTMIVKVSF